MAAPLTLWQKIQSLFYPVRIRKSSSTLNPVLELFYHQGRYMLATPTAIYSDGAKYRPLVTAFETPRLKSALGRVQHVLVLGTGLASAVHILNAKSLAPKFTLVEIDKLVLTWAQEFLPVGVAERVLPVEESAFSFIARDTATYDLIIVDIFFGRDVPDTVTEASFLMQCKARLTANGFLVLNYMERQNEAPGKAKAALEAIFNTVTEVSFGINKVYVASA